jgi:SAM-dependent methyltransferase
MSEMLPCLDQFVELVLCDAALDHLAEPERGIREMARVATPDGRVVLTFVNYGGLTVRASRLVYRIGRALRLLPVEAEKQKLFLDSPVPYEHNFECTLANVSEMCRPYLELDHAYGISLGWMFPGWGRLLERLPSLQPLLARLDRVARARPRIADFVISVWRPRPRAEWPSDELRIRRSNPVYRGQLVNEAAYWEKANFGTFFRATNTLTAPSKNRGYTGDPARSGLPGCARAGARVSTCTS